MLEFTTYVAYCLLAIALAAALIKAAVSLYHKLVGDVYFQFFKIIYTEGKLLGWTMHTLCIMRFHNSRLTRYTIPFFPISYNKQHAIELRITRDRIENMIDKGEL